MGSIVSTILVIAGKQDVSAVANTISASSNNDADDELYTGIVGKILPVNI